MAQNNSINVVSLDFEENKASLKAYMQSQTVLKDYDFDGSVLSTILDVLAYNTHYQAFYTNMVANEMFLDSAILRPSVVSHAKHLGYLPSSITASKALVDIVLTSAASSDTYLARGTEFGGINPAGTRYKFVNLETAFATSGATAFGGVSLYEGSLRQITYIYNKDTKIGSYLIIPNSKADISTIKVRIHSSITDRTGIDEVWSLGEDYTALTPTSKVYFLQEKEAGIYELYFGDGVLGQQPQTGNVVSIEYLETNGAVANGVNSFTKSDSAISYIQFTADPITGSTISESYGGSELEDVSRIKFTAPKFYQTSNRAVTENDYSALVFKLYPNTSSVSIYGGETMTPPKYGDVYIAIKPKSGGFLTSSEKTSLEASLRQKYSVLSITPHIVNPEYMDLIIDTTVVHNPNTLSVTSGVLKTYILAYIYGFSAAFLERFGSNFYYSKMVEGINGIHPSILGVYSKIKLRKSIDASVISTSKSYTFRFDNAFYHPHSGHSSILSSNLIPHKDLSGTSYTDTTLQDDGNGVINVVRPDPNSTGSYLIVFPSVGTIDYTQGTVLINSKFSPQISNGGISYPVIITVEPDTTNIYIKENQIMRINASYLDSVKVTLTTETDAEALAAIR